MDRSGGGGMEVVERCGEEATMAVVERERRGGRIGMEE